MAFTWEDIGGDILDVDDMLERLQELSDSKWPFTCIDWEQAAKELNQDYTSIELRPLDENGEECDAITYYYRA